MSKNPEKFISQEPQESGKLTPEEVKEMVEKYKKEHEGLLPEYFSLPGEEKGEEERELSEETMLAREIKKFLEEIRPELENGDLIKNAGEKLKSDIESIESGQKSNGTMDIRDAIWSYALFKQSGLWSNFNQEFRNWVEKNIKDSKFIENAKEWLKSKIESGQKPNQTTDACRAIVAYVFFKRLGLWLKFNQEFRDWVEEHIQNLQLIKNAEKDLKFDIESGQKPGKTFRAWWAIYSYTFFKQSGLWSNFNQEFRNWVEKNIKDSKLILIENAKEEFKSDIKFGQKPSETKRAWWAVRGYVIFLQFQKILEEEGRKKDVEIESQKAMHPKKELPPIPEEKVF